MRKDVILCDVCKKEHDAQYVLPRAWIRTIQVDTYELEIEHHFCSKACLIKWAQEDEA